jgi:hypothetical protein
VLIASLTITFLVTYSYEGTAAPGELREAADM